MPAMRTQDGRAAERNREPRDNRRQGASTIANMRQSISQMFVGESRLGRQEAPLPEPPLDSPKTPRLLLGLQNFSTTRIAIPYLNRNSISLPNSPIGASPPLTPLSIRPVVQTTTTHNPPATISSIPSHVRHNSARRSVGVETAETRSPEMAAVGRTRNKKVKPTKKQRSCGPTFKHKRVRAKVLTCIISGLILVIVLAIYLALALTKRQESQEFHVLLILIILITTIFFCHGLIRLCMLLLHPPSVEDDLERQHMPSMTGAGGYANPVVPIRVVLARDEEAAGIESTATKLPPPVYGLWRESVRVDPNRLYWQRNEAAGQRQLSNDRPDTPNRPPSYISEDGVTYVVEAMPRSIAPSTDVPLPLHPSERGRMLPLRSQQMR